VYRWTGTTWQKRGTVPFVCTNDAVPAGMSTRIAALYGATLKGAQNGCSPGPTSTPEPTTGPLNPGATGERVKALQSLLIAANLLRGTADGVYGSGTRAAIYDYQFLNSLAPTGIADEALLATFAGWAVPVTTTTMPDTSAPAAPSTSAARSSVVTSN
jgi:peptidoglycan hydrolase-like protein with peptidoglycan-binding domain